METKWLHVVTVIPNTTRLWPAAVITPSPVTNEAQPTPLPS